MMERMLRKAKAKQAIVQLIRRLLTNAPRYFDFVIVDTPPVIDEVTLSALRNADRLLLVCTPDVPAIRALRNELNILPTFNIPEEQVRLILNLVRRGGELMPREVKALFETRQWLPDVPYDPKIEPLVNTSTLVLEGPRETAFGAAIKNLAKAVLDDRAAARDALPALGVASVYE
jgi:pilus assembly protein CpaE